MASEAVVSDHPVPCEEVEEELQSEANKKSEADNVSALKESTDSRKPEETPCPAATCAASETETDKKQQESPVVSDAKDINAEDRAQLVAPTEEKIVRKADQLSAAEELKTAEPTDKSVEPPPAQEPKKTEAAPTEEKLEVKPEEEKKAEAAPPLVESTAEKPEDPPSEVQKETKAAPPPAESTEEEKIEDKPVEPPVPGEKKLEDKDIQEAGKEAVPEPDTANISEEPTVEKSDSKPEGKSGPEPEVEKQQEPEKAEELPPKVAEATEAKGVTISEAARKPEKPAAPTVEDKLPQQPQVIQQIEKIEVKGPANEVEDIKLSKEKETSATESSDQVRSETPGEGKDTEMTGEGDELREPTKDKASSEGKAVKAETGEKIIVAERLVQCEEKQTEYVTNSAPPLELADESPEAKVASTGIEPEADNGNNKDDKEATKEPEKTEAAEAKSEEEKRVDEKIEETAQAAKAKLEEEKQAQEPAQIDIQNSECTKDVGETKTTLDAPKGDVPVKTQKQSIVKMVKQSLVKAKKAITGKSHSKTPAPEPKG